MQLRSSYQSYELWLHYIYEGHSKCYLPKDVDITLVNIRYLLFIIYYLLLCIQ